MLYQIFRIDNTRIANFKNRSKTHYEWSIMLRSVMISSFFFPRYKKQISKNSRNGFIIKRKEWSHYVDIWSKSKYLHQKLLTDNNCKPAYFIIFRQNMVSHGIKFEELDGITYPQLCQIFIYIYI